MHDYGTLLAAEAPGFDWPEIDETSAAAMCYTCGTTGNPKGVVYSHRSTFLHSAVSLATRAALRLTTATACSRSCRCSTRTPGACRTRRCCGAPLIMPGRFLQASRWRR